MRLFIATPVSTEIEKELARIISALKSVGGPVKWVTPSQIHLTLKFLGDTDDKLVPRLKRAIDEIVKNHPSISSGLSGLGVFPDYRRPRVFWVGLERGTAELSKIVSEIDNAVHTLGFAIENRPFKAHLTLGRVKEPLGLERLSETAKSLKINQLPMIFDRIILFQSTLMPQGPIYQNLHEAKLK